VRAGDRDDRGAPALNAPPPTPPAPPPCGAGAPARSLVAVGGSPLEVAIWTAEPRPAGDLQTGEGALVMLHEGLGSVDLWREFPQLLARASGRSVIAFSRHGHGRSGPPPRARTPSFFAEEALEVLPALLGALGVRRPVLVGHSDGASIALIHAAHHPVGAVAALAPHVFVEELTLAAIRQARERYLRGELRQRLARHHDDVDAAFFGWCDVWLDPAFAHWSIEREVELIRAPMLLVQGTEDPYGTLEQLARIERRARAPVARLVLPGGHSPHREHAAMLAQRIASFIEDAGGP